MPLRDRVILPPPVYEGDVFPHVTDGLSERAKSAGSRCSVWSGSRDAQEVRHRSALTAALHAPARNFRRLGRLMAVELLKDARPLVRRSCHFRRPF